MDLLIHSNRLPGGNTSREFEGKEYGAGLTLILVNGETATADHLRKRLRSAHPSACSTGRPAKPESVRDRAA